MNYLHFGLGRKPSPIDARDYKLAAYMPTDLGDLSGGMSWGFGVEALDQGDYGHCVGFGGADFGINNPVQDNYTNKDGHDLYYKCKIIDGEPGMENGSTVRSIAKVLRNIGRLNAYAFAASTDEITYWILHNGPVIAGTDWTEGMFTPDASNIIHPTGEVAGGHCYLLNEKTASGYYGIQNSWDNRWGVNGKAYISIADFAGLLESGGEAMTSVELPLASPANNNSCVTAFLQKLGILSLF